MEIFVILIILLLLFSFTIKGRNEPEVFAQIAGYIPKNFKIKGIQIVSDNNKFNNNPIIYVGDHNAPIKYYLSNGAEDQLQNHIDLGYIPTTKKQIKKDFERWKNRKPNLIHYVADYQVPERFRGDRITATYRFYDSDKTWEKNGYRQASEEDIKALIIKLSN